MGEISNAKVVLGQRFSKCQLDFHGFRTLPWSTICNKGFIVLVYVLVLSIEKNRLQEKDVMLIMLNIAAAWLQLVIPLQSSFQQIMENIAALKPNVV